MKTLITKTICIIICLSFTGTAVPITATKTPDTKTGVSCLAPKMYGTHKTEEATVVEQLMLHLVRPDKTRPAPNTTKEWLREYAMLAFIETPSIFGSLAYMIAQAAFEHFAKKSSEPTKAESETNLKALIDRITNLQRSPDTAKLETDIRNEAKEIDAYIQKYIVSIPEGTYTSPETLRFYNQVILLDLWNKFPEMFDNQLGQVSAPENTANPLALESIMKRWDAKLAKDISLCGYQIKFGPIPGGAVRQIAQYVFDNRMNTRFPDGATSILSSFYSDIVLIHYMSLHKISIPSDKHPGKNNTFRTAFLNLSKRGYTVRTIMHNFDIAPGTRYFAALEKAHGAPHNDTAQLDEFNSVFFKGAFGQNDELNKMINDCNSGGIKRFALKQSSALIRKTITLLSGLNEVQTDDFDTLRYWQLLTLIDLWNTYPEMFGYDFEFFKSFFREYEAGIRFTPNLQQPAGEAFFATAAGQIAEEIFNIRVKNNHKIGNNTQRAAQQYLSDFYSELAMRAYAQDYNWEKTALISHGQTAASISSFMVWLIGVNGYQTSRAFRALNSPGTMARMNELLESQPEFFREEIFNPAAIAMDITLLRAA